MTIEDKETKRQSRLFQSCLREELSSCTHLTSEEERERDADFCINSANQKLSKVLNWFELKFRRIQTLPVFLTLSLSLSLSFSLTKSCRNVLSKKFFLFFLIQRFLSSLWLQESLKSSCIPLPPPSTTIYFENLFLPLSHGINFQVETVF